MATMTITTTAGEDARLIAAFGNFLHPGRPATAAEIKAWVIEQVKNVVVQDELNVAKAAVSQPAAFAPT